MLIFVVSAVTMIGVSYATAAPSAAQIQGLTFATVTPEQKAETRRSWNHWDVDQLGHRAGADPLGLRLLQRLAVVSPRCGFGVALRAGAPAAAPALIHDGAPVALIFRA